MNPMMASLNRNQTQPAMMEQISQLKQLSEVMKNPVGVAKTNVMAQIQNHPLYAKAKEIADRFGGDWNRAFQETAKSVGIDPNQITSMLHQQGLV